MQYSYRECGRSIGIYAVIVIAILSGGALAQNNTNQPPGGTNSTTATTQRQAPVGHRQPKAKDLPADVLQRQQTLNHAEKACRNMKGFGNEIPH